MSKTKKRVLLYLWSFSVAVLCLLICTKSSFLYPINDWVDAQALFTAGKGILHGRVLYLDTYEHKGPLIYMLNAGCALISHSSMIGVFVLEVLCFTLFLAAVYRFLRLFGAGVSACLVMPLVGMIILSSPSFLMGGSAEEYALPLLAWSLYFILRWVKTGQPMQPGIVLLNGVFFGLVFWIKFTMVGFYLPWLLFPFLYFGVKKQWRQAWKLLGFFALGFVIATLPWLLYFGIHHAILPWLKVYLYDNLFVYGSIGAPGSQGLIGVLHQCKAILGCCIDWFLQNPLYSVPMAIGLVWITLSRASSAREKWLLWLLIGFTALGIFFTGKAYLYYGLLLASFGGLMALPLCRLLDRFLSIGRKAMAALSLAMLLLAGALCYVISPNTGSLLKPRGDTLQYRIAAIVNQTPDATLLNYSAMDVGFYTACNIVPNVKYFHRPNVPLAEVMEEQNRYVQEGLTDYVVVELVGSTPDLFRQNYELVAEEMGWSLYRLKSLHTN